MLSLFATRMLPLHAGGTDNLVECYMSILLTADLKTATICWLLIWLISDFVKFLSYYLNNLRELY